MNKNNIIIAPSMLASDFGNIQSEAQRMISAGADWLHLDIMDGHFVPNITFGPCVVAAIHKHHPNVFLDCHLMVSNPLQWIDALHEAGASSLTFHVESDNNISALIQHTRSLSMSVGLAISPDTNINWVLGYSVDMILVMTVHPGFGGQKFMENCLHKVTALRELYPNIKIQVDGGISKKTIEKAYKAGANAFVAGSALFGAKDAKKSINTFRSLCKKSDKKEIKIV